MTLSQNYENFNLANIMIGIKAKENGGKYDFFIENNTVSIPIGPPGELFKLNNIKLFEILINENSFD